MALLARTPVRVALTFATLSAALLAHGGQYQGPPPQLPVPKIGRPGSSGRPAAPSAPAPSTPAVTGGGYVLVAPSVTRWQQWWEFNQRPFLLGREVRESLPVTGSDDFYLGAGRHQVRFDMLAPTDKDLIERIVPALAALLEKERNRDIVTACLVALGKIGRDAPGVVLEEVIQKHIPRDDQEVRETAVLALGIAGRKAAYPILVSLLRDEKTGRRLVERDEVKERTRAFAGYSLGLLAARAPDVELKQNVHDVLWAVLADPKQKDRDLNVAAVSGLGILDLQPRGLEKRLLWQTVDELFTWFEADRGAGFEAIQAHAPIAVGRLLGRGNSPVHRRAKERLVEELTARKPRGNPILRSSAIALGMMAVPSEHHSADAVFSQTLRDVWEDARDQSTRFFSLISLGRIGGPSNREFLVQSYIRGRKGTEKPWAALALGLQAYDRGTADKPDEVIARMLLDDLRDVSDNSLMGALAISLGLTGYKQAAPAVQRLLVEHESDQEAAGYLCLTLALLGERAASHDLTQLLKRSTRRPFLVQRCAIALGQLGDRQASTNLVDLMQQSDSVAVLSALAIGIGRIRDRRSIGPLLDLLDKRDLTKIARGFVAAALGGIGDKELLPFNTRLTVDSNYMEPVNTLTNGLSGVLDIL